MATWSYLIYDIIGPAGAIGFLGYLASTTLQTASGVNVPWWIFALATFAVVWFLTHYGIRLSMRTTALFGGIEMLIMLALAITFLVHPAHGSSFTAPLHPSSAPNHYRGILAGMVFSVLAVIVLYVMANLALTAYIRREHPGDFSFWRHGVLPWIGTLALLPVLFITVWPIPPWPFNLTPYFFVAALIAGFGYMRWRESKNPGSLARGATMLVGRAGRAGRRAPAGRGVTHRGRAGRDRAAGL